jgi:RNA recognition motif-containing protein
MKLFVAPLRRDARLEEATEVFERYGYVIRAHIVQDRNTGTSRGFAFVTMPRRDAERAIAALNGSEFRGGRCWLNQHRIAATSMLSINRRRDETD